MRKRYYGLCLLLAVAWLLAACGPEVAPPPPAAPATSSEVEAEAHSDTVWVVHQDQSRDTLPSTEQTMLSVREGVDVDQLGRAVLRFADLLFVEVLRQGQLQVRELSIDQQTASVSVVQGLGTALYDFHPQEQIDRRLNVTTEFAQVVATGTKFMIVREADSPLEWVLAFDATADDLTVEADGMAEGVETGVARWVAPVDGPGLPVSFDAENVNQWVARARSGQAQPEIGEVLWPQADVLADTTVLDDIPAPGEPFFLEGVQLELDPHGLYGNPEYWLEDCNGDGIRDIAMRSGRLKMDFRPVLSRVRALDVTVANLGQPGSGALTVLDPARAELDIQEVTAPEGAVQVLSLRSEPGQPYHYAELAMGHGCFLGFSLTPPLPTGEPAEPRPAVEVGEILPPPTATPGPESPTPTTRPPTPTPAPETPLCTVVASKLNVRSGPGTVYDVTSQVARGAELVPLGRNTAAGWVFVRVAQTGRQGWVSAESRYVSCNVDIRDLEPVEAPPTPTPLPTEPPTPEYRFEPAAATIRAGECVTLKWATANVQAVYFEGEGVRGTDSRQVCPGETTTYRLRVDTYLGRQELTSRITVRAEEPQPYTITFWAKPTTITAGQCTTVGWETSNVQAVYFEGGGVIGSDSRSECPGETRDYHLRVETYQGTQERTVTVVVNQPVAGPGYECWSESGIETGCWTVRWKVWNAREVYYEGEGVAGEGYRVECPTSSTEYTLRIVGLDGKDYYCRVPIEVSRETVLQTPQQLKPPDGSVFDHYPRTTTLGWSAVPGDPSYLQYGVEVDCFHCCESNAWCTDVGETWMVERVGGTSYTFDYVGAQPGRWRVWAVDLSTGLESAKSGWWEFEYLR